MTFRQRFRKANAIILALQLFTIGCGEGEFLEPRKPVPVSELNKQVEFTDTSFHEIIESGSRDRIARVKALIAKGGDLNEIRDGGPPCIQAVGWGGQYDIALLLLEAGADYRIYYYKQNTRLIHYVVRDQSRLPYVSPEQRRDYGRLVAWLQAHGESVSAAQKDWARWKAFSPNLKVAAKQHRAEREARLRREEKENEDAPR